MRKVASLFIFFIISLVFVASSPFPSNSNVVIYPNTVEIFSPSDPSLSVAEVVERHASDFRPVSGNVVRLYGFDEALWLRIPTAELRRLLESFRSSHGILVLQKAHIFRTDCFLSSGPGEFRRLDQGLGVSSDRGKFASRYPVFRLPGAMEDGYLYMNLRASLPVAFDLLVLDEDEFYGRFLDRLAGYMAFYSFMLALAFACLLFYFMTGDGGYLWVALRQTMALVFLFAFNGYLRFYFDFPLWAADVLIWLSLGVHCISAAFSCMRLIRVDSEYWGRGLVYLQSALGLAMTFFALADLPVPAFCALGAALAVEIFSFMSMGILRFREGYRMILLYVFSRLAFVFGILFLVLEMLLPGTTRGIAGCMMFCFLLDPILLIFLMIPETRHRLENYYALEEKSMRYENLSQRDGMTGLYNKAHLLSLLEGHLRAARDGGKSLAFIMMDIDHFKTFNDTWGHPEGDRMLAFLAKIIRQCLRESDIAARYGGEEFSVILPGGTLPTSILVGERIRKTFERESGSLGEKKATTVSLGLSFAKSDDTVSTLIQRADDALYRAKANGRNRTEFEVTE